MQNIKEQINPMANNNSKNNLIILPWGKQAPLWAIRNSILIYKSYARNTIPAELIIMQINVAFLDRL